MTSESYFKKKGYVYGIEGDLTDGPGFRVYDIVEFTDYTEAIDWIKMAPEYRRRFLDTYTAKRYYEINCLVGR